MPAQEKRVPSAYLMPPNPHGDAPMTTPATPATAPAAAPMTYEQFLDCVDEDTRAEFVEGRIVVSSPVSRDHQLSAGFW